MNQPSNPGPTFQVGVRFPKADALALQHLADARGVTLAALIRESAAPTVALARHLAERS